MSDMLFSYVPNMSLRSSGTGLLTTPKPRTKRHGEAAFSYYAPSLWNREPVQFFLFFFGGGFPVVNISVFMFIVFIHFFSP